MSLYKRIVLLIFILLVPLTIARLALYTLYFSTHFAELTWQEAALAFGYGLVFDLSAGLTFAGLPLLACALPFPPFQKKIWQAFWLWAFFILLSGMVFFLLGDIVYFKSVGRHVFDELSLVTNDLGMFRDFILASYLGTTLCFILVMVLAGWGWHYFVNSVTFFPKPKQGYVFFLALVIFCILAIRGGFSPKPINIIDAYLSSNTLQGQLVLNGIFTASHASLSSERFSYQTLKPEHLNAVLSIMGIDASEPWPFWKTSQPLSPGKKWNVVVLLLESWSSYYVDSFSNHNFKVTPEFDALAQRSLKFSNFFANGTRSIEAIQGILTGFPALKGMPTLGVGLELLSISKLGRLANASGYETFFLQSSPRRSFRLDAAAKALGFEHYFGMEDYPRKLDYTDTLTPTFGYDYETLMFALDKFSQSSSPFLGFLFTGTTHTPFILPPHPLNADQHGRDNEQGLLNTLHYADWSLGEFFRAAEKTSWYKDTIFILTSDHTFNAYRKFSFIENHSVPLLIHAPTIFKPDTREIYGSHLDLLPTILSFFGTPESYAGVGKSLLEKKTGEDELVFISGKFGNPALINPKAFLRHTYQQRLEAKTLGNRTCDAACFQSMEDKLLALHQALHSAMRENRWSKN